MKKKVKIFENKKSADFFYFISTEYRTSPQSTDEDSASFSDNIMCNSISMQAADMGFSVDDITFAWQMKMTEHEMFTSIQQLIDSILTDSDSSFLPAANTPLSPQPSTSRKHKHTKSERRSRHHQRLRTKYTALKKRYECKICFASEVVVVNLPCGHAC